VKWHTFAAPEAEVEAPDFCLTSSTGDTICDRVYRGRAAQVLVFASGDTLAEWTPLLAALSEHAEGFVRQGAVVLALLPAAPEPIRSVGRDLAYHFPILADPGAQVRREYERLLAGDTGTSHLVFVLSAQGTPYAAAINANPADPALYDQVAEWLRLVAVQCPV